LALPNAEREAPLDGLKDLISDNAPLTCRLFRAIFEHLLGFVAESTSTQTGVSLVSDLTGRKEHSRAFLSTALFILGAEIDRDHLMSFMMEQGLFGLPIFEHMLRNRDYCEAFHSFRRLDRAFMGPPAPSRASWPCSSPPRAISPALLRRPADCSSIRARLRRVVRAAPRVSVDEARVFLGWVSPPPCNLHWRNRHSVRFTG
jgi:hypothetical protein